MFAKMLIAGTASMLLALPVVPAVASSDDGAEAKSKGRCSGSAWWELEVEERDSGVRVKFEVDSAASGESWDYTLTGPSGEIASGTATTSYDGSFEIKRSTSGAVTDSFVGVATSGGQECNTSLNVVSSYTDDDSSDDDSSDDRYDDDRDDDGRDDDGRDDDGREDDRDDDSRGEVKTRGVCSASARWEFELEEEGSGVDVEFEVDSVSGGEVWDYTITGPSGELTSGAATTRRDGSFKVKVRADGTLADSYSAVATSNGQVCDTGQNVVSTRKSENYDGSCTASSVIAMNVARKGKARVATVRIDGSRKGEKWRYTIKRKSKVVKKGVKKAKGRAGVVSVKAKAKGKGRLVAKARTVSSSERCSADNR